MSPDTPSKNSSGPVGQAEANQNTVAESHNTAEMPKQPPQGAVSGNQQAQVPFGYGQPQPVGYPPQGPFVQQMPMQGAPIVVAGAPSPQFNATHSVGFFKALFDLDFKYFVTLKFAKFQYIFSIILTFMTWLVLFFIATKVDGGLAAMVLLLGWIPAAANVLLLRIMIEVGVALMRTAENTTILAQNK